MKTERRLARRFIMRVPLRFRLLKDPSTPERAADSMNISRRGVYFATDLNVSIGLPVQVRLTMPEEVVGSQAGEWCYTGRIVHADRLGSNGTSGVGVQFLYYEVE